MEPTVEVGDMVLVNKAEYCVSVPFTGWCPFAGTAPVRGDVVVLDSPEDGKLLLKRVVAVPGDVAAVHGGRSIIDGHEVPVVRGEEQMPSREHRISLRHGGGPTQAPLRVPRDQYLVVGDNRGNSHDGRSFGLVPGTSIRGRVRSVFRRGGSWAWHPL